MSPTDPDPCFMQAFGIVKNDIVTVIGAGGKTSLVFRLAKEAKTLGYKSLVTTTTHMLIPHVDEYDFIDLSGNLFRDETISAPGIYVGGSTARQQGKMTGGSTAEVDKTINRFDLVLIEGDGASGKQLKGWEESEPVVPQSTTKTIGIVDIQAVGSTIDDHLAHRLEHFLNISGSREKEAVRVDHLINLIHHERGLFSKAVGETILYVNKVEGELDRNHSISLTHQLQQLNVVSGSINHGVVHGQH